MPHYSNETCQKAPKTIRNVLIVDDVESVAEFIREVLVAFDHNAEISLNVNDALKRFEKGKYDLVVTDYNMPDMSGVEFARAIRARSSTQPILLITGGSLGETSNSEDSRHFNASLQKPFTITEFQQTLAGIFDAHA